MATGRVIRTHSNISYVLAEGREVECRARGKFRLDRQDVLAGDLVEVTLLEDGEGRIEKVLPRGTVMQRPAVANVDQAIPVFTLREPEANLQFLDRVLVHAEQAGLRILIALNKIDLCTEADVAEFAAIYEPAGYQVLPMAAKTGQGVGAIRSHLADRLSVLAGQSGVGKSRLVRTLEPGRQDIRVGAVSDKLGRGRHTTRHVELIPTCGGLLVDAPGFTYLEFGGLEKADLATCFPEFRPLAPACRFADCLHRKEPDCAVLEAVGRGLIRPSRHENYLAFLAEIEQQKRW